MKVKWNPEVTPREAVVMTLEVSLLAGAWAVFPRKTALWVNGALLLLGFAVADIINAVEDLDEDSWVPVEDGEA